MKRTTARQEAKAQGLHTYKSNKPCKYGHDDSLRYTSNAGCVACYQRYHKLHPHRRRRKNYDRERNTILARGYRDRHREKLRKYLREYMRTYRKRPEAIEYNREYHRLDYAKHKDDPDYQARCLARNRAYRQMHKDDPEFKQKNRERSARARARKKAQMKAAA